MRFKYIVKRATAFVKNEITVFTLASGQRIELKVMEVVMYDKYNEITGEIVGSKGIASDPELKKYTTGAQIVIITNVERNRCNIGFMSDIYRKA